MRRLAFVAFALAASLAARAQFAADFEAPAYSGSAAGTLLTGQVGWYLPPSSNDFNVYTYASNSLGFVQNPQGGSQFAAGRPDATGTLFGRGQHDVSFAAFNQYTITFDRAGLHSPGSTIANNLGSFSLQPSGTSQYTQFLYFWKDVTNPGAGYQSYVLAYDAAGVALPGGAAGAGFQLPGASWDNQAENHWYRDSMTIDFSTHQIVKVGILDLTTMAADSFTPQGWYLFGGANPTVGRPTAIRMFGGGPGTPIGNVMGFDNLGVVPEPATIAVMMAGLAGVLIRRRKK